MSKLARGMSGKFEQKGDQPRQVHSVRVTDDCWNALGLIADQKACTRGDVLEEIAKSHQIYRILVEDDEYDRITFKEHLSGILNGLYDRNELEISSKDKAATKRAFEKLLNILDTL